MDRRLSSTKKMDSIESTASGDRLRRNRIQPLLNDTSIKCKICMRTFVEPRILPCLHSFCTRCLYPLINQEIKDDSIFSAGDSQSSDSSVQNKRTDSKISHQNSCCQSNSHVSCETKDFSSVNTPHFPIDEAIGSFQVLKCPICETNNVLPEQGIDNLPLNYVIQNRISTALQEHSTCNNCLGDVPATTMCQDCQKSLCTFCTNEHLQQNQHNHDIMFFHGIMDTASQYRQAMCSIHSTRELRLFCKQCNILVCRDCCMESHQTHSCETAAKVSRQFKTVLKDALSKAQPLAKESVLSLLRLQNLKHRIQARCSEIEKEVESFSESYRKAVDEHHHILLREITQVKENKLTALDSFHQLLTVRTEQTSQAVNFTQEVLNESSDIELLNVVNLLLKRLKWCQESPPIASPKVSECLHFLPEERACVINTHPLWGVITTQSVSPYHCVLETSGLLNCRQNKKAEFILKMCDSDGQQICHGGETVNAELQYRDSQRQVTLKVHDRGNGTYLLSFTPDTPGNLILSVTVKKKNIQGSPFNVSVSTQRPHPGIYHCCTFCSSNGNKNTTCACGGQMEGYSGCGHGHSGHPGQRHWSCCGNLLHNSECTRPSAES